MNEWLGQSIPAVLDGDMHARSMAAVDGDAASFQAATQTFIEAGAEVVRAPGADAVRWCREIAPDTRVWGVLAPAGKLLVLKEAEPDELTAHYAAQAGAVDAAGPDALLVDGLSDLDEALIACRAVRGVTQRPLGVGFVFGGGADHDETVLGTGCEEIAGRMGDSGATFLACTCQLPVDEMVLIVRLLCTHGRLPVVACPDAGQRELDGDGVVHRESPGEFADKSGSLVAAGAVGIGGCCGVGPQHIAALTAALRRG